MADTADNYDFYPDDIDYVLKRPDQYIGNARLTTAKMWILDEEANTIISKEIDYVPGFYKVFDELLVNARDHVIRRREKGTELCDTIKVEITPEYISVWNNGAGIPIQINKKAGIYVPEMIFGRLKSGSNFDDDKKRKWGGLNGLGAKLANIYSTEFFVETVSSTESKKYVQRFFNNMRECDKPSITKATCKPYTKITMKPDLAKFGLKEMTEDTVSLFKKRVYDIALVGAKVWLNGKPIKINTLAKYVDMYFPDGTEFKKHVEESNPDWKVAVIFDPTDTMEHQNVSFVNGTCTTRGGPHVDYVVNQIVRKIKAVLQTKLKNAVLKDSMIKDNLVFFIDACIENPNFDSQCKEALTTRISEFGTKYEAPEAFLNKILKMGIVERIQEKASIKAVSDLAKETKAGKRLTGIKKLVDAHEANLRNGECTLILTEGDSALALAVSGLSVVGRAKYGAFPLKGKLLNVRDQSIKTIMGNEEMKNIIQILGLEVGKKYKNPNDLRYCKIMIMADQDLDGFHIKGLLINAVHHFWPDLLKNHPFICSLATPIIKAIVGKKAYEFHDLRDYEQWKVKPEAKDHKAKYYKGLGTSTSKEAKEYFADLENKLVTYDWQDYEKGETDKLIDMVFNKKLADERKEWINSLDETAYLDYKKGIIPYKDFFNVEMCAFSAYDVARSIPSAVDGLKTCQRKVMFACFKRNLKNEIKVAQLAGYVSENAAYHHGEASLMGAIIGMAQDYVGSNNINLLMPSGQFGTRLAGGKDNASPRYIFTCLNKLADIIFNPIDREIADYQTDDGMLIEPKYYVPILPMILVNGADGIGTGWSTKIPCFDPKVIVENLRRVIRGDRLLKMKPYYRHYTGEITEVEPGKYLTKGIYTIQGDTLHVTELPIGHWTQKFAELVDDLVAPDKTGKSPAKGKNIGNDISKPQDDSSDTKVDFKVIFKRGTLSKYSVEEIEKTFKLSTTIAITNMHAWNHKNNIVKYERPTDIIKDFAGYRIKFYQKRKDYRLGQLETEIGKKRAIMRYIKSVDADHTLVFRKTIDQIKAYLANEEYPKFVHDGKLSYKYLLDIKLTQCSKEKVAELKKQLDALEEEYATLKAKTPQDLWLEDLDEFEAVYDEWKAADEKAYAELDSVPKANGKKTRRTKRV